MTMVVLFLRQFFIAEKTRRREVGSSAEVASSVHRMSEGRREGVERGRTENQDLWIPQPSTSKAKPLLLSTTKRDPSSIGLSCVHIALLLLLSRLLGLLLGSRNSLIVVENVQTRRRRRPSKNRIVPIRQVEDKVVEQRSSAGIFDLLSCRCAI